MLASRNLDDIIYHEAAHFMTFQDCESWQDFIDKEALVRAMYIPGVAEYNTFSRDGSETIAEGFVALENGEDVPDNIKNLVRRMIRRKK